METFFFVYFHKDDIVPDLADTFPGNDIFIITSEQAAESSGAWKYKGGELTAFAVKFRINGTSETAAGTDINYFFCFNSQIFINQIQSFRLNQTVVPMLSESDMRLITIYVFCKIYASPFIDTLNRNTV